MKDKIMGRADEDTTLIGSLGIIKKELFSIDVPELNRLMEKAVSTKDRIIDQKCIVFIGDTGSGKTTLIKALYGCKMCKKTYKNINWITTAEPITDPDILAMHSFPISKSITRYISAVLPMRDMRDEEIYLVDTPGLKDTGGIEVELANSYGVVKALEQCREITIVLVVSIYSWGNKGGGLKLLV